MSHYAKVREPNQRTEKPQGATLRPQIKRVLGLVLFAALFVGSMIVLANVIWIPLKLSGSANVTENNPPPTESKRYVSNVTIFNLGSIKQGSASQLTTVRITNVSTETGPLTFTIESTATGLTPLTFWPGGADYSTPAILAPGEHVDLLVGIQTSASTATGAITFKIVLH